MELRGWLLIAAAVLSGLTPQTWAQPTNRPAPWRAFTAADGLAETACLSVTAGPNGDVLVRHLQSDAVSVFDGYDFVTVPGPSGERARVYESPSGQLWTVSTAGLREFRNGEWPLVPVPQVAEHHRTGRMGEIILLPVRQGRVLVLLPGELLQVALDNPEVRTETLTRSSELQIGTFTNLLAARNGALLLAGTAGFARSAQPFRALLPGASWEVLTQSPAEFSILESPKLQSPWPASIHDQLVVADGSVWLATSAGLVRFAPPIWEPYAGPLPPNSSPPDLTAKDRAVILASEELGQWQAVFKARNGDLWLGAGTKVARVHGDAMNVFASTNQAGPEAVSAFVESPDGRIVCATPTKVWEFDGRDWLPLRVGFECVNGLLYARDGTLWVAANEGLYRFTRGAWVANGPADGLPVGNVLSVVEDTAGGIIARTTMGVCRLQRAADREPPRPEIKPLPAKEMREGAPVRFAFRGRDRWNVTTPERLLFSFKLDESEWSPFQELTEVVRADLPPGRHLFLVRAMDRNANIDRQPARLEFEVVLPWYRETRLVYILAGALVVALFFAGLAFNRHRHLQLSYADVERQVTERTRELEQAQRGLLHSQKMNALGTLAAGIAHDFNNILSIIKGSAQIIEDNPGNEAKIRTRLDRIKTVVQQGAGIVEAMLGFSRQSPGQVASCDVNDIVDDTLKLLGDRFLRGVEVKFDRNPNLPQIPVVRDFVQQALLNFIFNAAEAMERQTPDRGAGQGELPTAATTARNQIRLCTELSRTLPTGLFLKPATTDSFIQISVSDTGEGITTENLPRIFEPFFTTKALSSQRGTGLGLSMVYELARKLDAGLAVESEPGKGSTFTLILPVNPP